MYWSTAALDDTGEGGLTAPYSTADFDATTLLACQPVEGPERQCPAGILRMDQGQASVVITGPDGEEFTINFMTDYVNSGGHDIQAELQGDTWMVVVDGKTRYEVPLAAIEGG